MRVPKGIKAQARRDAAARRMRMNAALDETVLKWLGADPPGTCESTNSNLRQSAVRGQQGE
jgi:hypothetical protein